MWIITFYCDDKICCFMRSSLFDILLVGSFHNTQLTNVHVMACLCQKINGVKHDSYRVCAKFTHTDSAYIESSGMISKWNLMMITDDRICHQNTNQYPAGKKHNPNYAKWFSGACLCSSGDYSFRASHTFPIPNYMAPLLLSLPPFAARVNCVWSFSLTKKNGGKTAHRRFT